MSAVVEGEKDFDLPVVDSEQAVTSKIFSFSSSSWSPVLPLPDMPECDFEAQMSKGRVILCREASCTLEPPECVGVCG